MTHRFRSWVRWGTWATLAAIICGRLALDVAPIDPITRSSAAGIVAYMIPLALGFAGCLAVAAVTLGSGAEHRYWGSLATALGLVLVAEVYWTWYSIYVDFHGTPLSSPVRLLFAAAVAVFVMMVVQLTTHEHSSRSARLLTYVDVASAAAVLYPFVYLSWTLRSFAGTPEPLLGAAQGALYPIGGLLICAATFVVMVGWKAHRWRSWEIMASSALGIFGIGMMAFPAWYPEWMLAEEPSTDWFAAVLGIGLYGLFAAAMYRMTAERNEPLARAWPMPQLRTSPWLRLYPVVFAAALPVLGWLSYRHAGTLAGLPVLVSAVLLAVLTAARSWLGALELTHHRLRSVTDTATGAYNDRHLHVRLDDLVATAADTGYPMTMAAFGLDGIREMPATCGQDVTDLALKRVADAAADEAGSGAEVFRTALDEIVVLLPGIRTDRAVRFAENVIAEAVAASASDRVSPLITAGIAAFPCDSPEPEGLIGCVRTALTEAQSGHRGFVVAYEADRLGHPEPPATPINLKTLRSTVRALAAAVDARDPATRHHSARVGRLATRLAKHIGLPEHRIELIELAAQMHDVGKIGVSDAVLLKPGALSEDERAAVEDHCDLGHRILLSANVADILPLVRHHHERWDGRGYPDRLAGDDIPLEARLLAICDTYETMTAGRPYRPACPPHVALEEIQANAGTQFDPGLVGAFSTMLSDARDENHLGWTGRLDPSEAAG